MFVIDSEMMQHGSYGQGLSQYGEPQRRFLWFSKVVVIFFHCTCSGDNSSCVNYSTEINPLLSSCTGCHGSSAGLSLSSYANLMSGGDSGAIVIAGDGSGSLMVKKLRGTASGLQMPKNQDPLDEATINLIETWINEGALDN